MSVDQATVRRIAHLARVAVEDKEVEHLQGEINAILSFVEALSAVDARNEARILSALEQVMQDRTTLVIAHRLSTVEKADLILVMEQGRIVERGSHAELLAANGHYARLHALQFSEARTTEGESPPPTGTG